MAVNHWCKLAICVSTDYMQAFDEIVEQRGFANRGHGVEQILREWSAAHGYQLPRRLGGRSAGRNQQTDRRIVSS